MRTNPTIRFSIVAMLVGVGLLWRTPAPAAQTTQNLPAQISDRDFWKMISEFSEEDSYFPFENFVSNEDSFLTVVPHLQQAIKSGSAYLGVGPEQNFSYVDAVQAKIAFIVDIRRQNMIEQLLYKAIFEMSADRADFLSRLFSRPRPEGLNAGSTADDMFARYGAVKPSQSRFDAGVKAVIAHLKGRGIALSSNDETSISHVYQAFFKGGPDLNFDYPGPHPADGTAPPPTFQELMTSKDGNRVQQSFLADETKFQVIKDMQLKNLIVPLVGDFSGGKTIRAVSEYLRQYNVPVGVFYVSNVEQYLFEDGDAWRRFYLNVATLQLDSNSIFVRSNSNWNSSLFEPRVKGRWLTLTCSILDLLNAFKRGQIQSYYDVFAFSK